jgi:hypothetical protein
LGGLLDFAGPAPPIASVSLPQECSTAVLSTIPSELLETHGPRDLCVWYFASKTRILLQLRGVDGDFCAIEEMDGMPVSMRLGSGIEALVINQSILVRWSLNSNGSIGHIQPNSLDGKSVTPIAVKFETRGDRPVFFAKEVATAGRTPQAAFEVKAAVSLIGLVAGLALVVLVIAMIAICAMLVVRCVRNRRQRVIRDEDAIPEISDIQSLAGHNRGYATIQYGIA